MNPGDVVQAVMETYRHFGLSAPPFDGQPDPRFFYGTPNHAETLATLQYAAHSGKSCLLVLGESGSGKTLLARLLVQSVGRRCDVLWVHGLGQRPGETVASVSTGGGPGPLGVPGGKNVADVHLAEWLRTPRPVRRPTLVVVDDADGLRPGAWKDVLSVITREVHPPTPVTAVLLALPAFAETLATPPMVRLQRRLFRVCHLASFTRAEVAAYVRHRVSVAGGNPDIFTPSALALLHRFSEGNPALINQLGDNALVETFGEDQGQVDARHVLAAVRSLMGEIDRQDGVTGPKSPESAAPTHEPLPDELLLSARLRSLTDRKAAPRSADASAMPEATSELLGDRLRTLESRLSEAFSRVRQARQRPVAAPDPVSDAVPEGSPS
jgi:general secretion pathway protein A